MGMFPDAEILAELVDASLMVVRQDYTAACDINDAIDSLRMYKAGFLGVILNDMVTSQRGRYGYHYGGQYGQTRSHGESHHNSTGKEK
jgi:Mrp family chromosome partitioning ATPase